MSDEMDVEPYLNTVVTDELFQQVQELEGQRIVGLALWEETLSDDGAEIPVQERTFVDMDLYLEDGVQMELYESALFSSLDADPVQGLDAMGTQLAAAIEAGLWLEEVAVDEEGLLVLVLTHKRQPVFYLNVGGWTTSEWDELPSDDEV